MTGWARVPHLWQVAVPQPAPGKRYTVRVRAVDRDDPSLVSDYTPLSKPVALPVVARLQPPNTTVQSDTSMLVRWPVPSAAGCCVVGYQLQLKDTRGSFIPDQVASKPEHVFSGLTPGEEYRCRVCSEAVEEESGERFTSEWSDWSRLTLPDNEAEERKRELESKREEERRKREAKREREDGKKKREEDRKKKEEEKRKREEEKRLAEEEERKREERKRREEERKRKEQAERRQEEKRQRQEEAERKKEEAEEEKRREEEERRRREQIEAERRANTTLDPFQRQEVAAAARAARAAERELDAAKKLLQDKAASDQDRMMAQELLRRAAPAKKATATRCEPGCRDSNILRTHCEPSRVSTCMADMPSTGTARIHDMAGLPLDKRNEIKRQLQELKKQKMAKEAIRKTLKPRSRKKKENLAGGGDGGDVAEAEAAPTAPEATQGEASSRWNTVRQAVRLQAALRGFQDRRNINQIFDSVLGEK